MNLRTFEFGSEESAALDTLDCYASQLPSRVKKIYALSHSFFLRMKTFDELQPAYKELEDSILQLESLLRSAKLCDTK